MDPKKKSEGPFWFKPVGWTLGLLVSVVFPNITAPMNLLAPFQIGGTIGGGLGFAAAYSFLRRRNVSGSKKLLGAVVVFAIGLVFMWVYRSLLFSPDNVNPGLWIELLELGLFCSSYFFLLAAFAYMYWNGGPLLLQKFGKWGIQDP